MNENQIIICSVYGKTTVIIKKIIILTVLGGQGIFIASLLLLIFFSCITQLEAREEREEVENLRQEREKRETDGLQRIEVERMWRGRNPMHVCG